jgi:hypothetical protein
MKCDAPLQLVARRYREVHGASLPPTFDKFMAGGTDQVSTAALGYRWASNGTLYLEAYLDDPVEVVASRALDRLVLREDIVELGNLAAANGMAMVQLWGRAANDLGSSSQIAVATLTASVRAMFARIRLPIVELACATPCAVGAEAGQWGSYYRNDPRVCAGIIAEGQEALSRYFARRAERRAA